MRLASAITLALILVLALIAGGARWLGQQRAGNGVPLPDAEGCWQSICFLDERDAGGVMRALRARPDVSGFSVQAFDGTRASEYKLLQFVFVRDRTGAIPVLVYWGRDTYNLTRDWRSAANPPLLRLGDVVATLGAPDQLTFLPDQVMLHYRERELRLLALRDPGLAPWVLLSPDDPVTNFSVIAPQSPADRPDTRTHYPVADWRGFGPYLTED